MIFRTTQLLLTFAAALLIPIGVHANDIEPGIEFYDAVKATNPIVLDGDLSEWTGVNVIVNPQFVPNGGGDLITFEPNGGGTWTGPDDQSSNVQVTWDDDNVYLGIIVTDDYHENAANSPWNGDSAQVHIANAGRDTQVGLYNFALGGVEDALGAVIVMDEAGPGGTDAVVTRNAPTTIYEIKLPKESLALAGLTDGVQFGLGFALNDGDDGADQNGQKGWGGLGPHAVVFGKTPAETALVTLQVPEPSSIGLCMMAIGTLLLRRRKGQR